MYNPLILSARALSYESLARSGWYVWCLRRNQISPRQKFRLICDEAIGKPSTEAKQRYGAPRLADELPEYNIKTIAASMRRQGMRAKATRKFSPVRYREHNLPVTENLLKQDFYASGPNQKWAGDITCCVPSAPYQHTAASDTLIAIVVIFS